MRIQEDYHNNLKNHEDEVNLRLKFEQKLNNLHAINRIAHQNLESTQTQLDNFKKSYDDLVVIHKEVKKEAEEHKEKAVLLEQKYNYVDARVQQMRQEMQSKNQFIENMNKEVENAHRQSELAGYRVNTMVKNLETQRLKNSKLEEEMLQVKEMKTHYKTVNKQNFSRIKELEQSNQELLDKIQALETEVSGQRREREQFDYVQSSLNQRIKDAEEEDERKTKELKAVLDDLAENKAKRGIAETDLGQFQQDYSKARQNIELINKARLDSEKNCAELKKTLGTQKTKMLDQEEAFKKSQKKLNEQDQKIVDLEWQVNQVEREKTQQKIDLESKVRLQLDQIHALEQQVRTENEMREQWSEKFERETKQLSHTNVEIMDLKSRVAGSDLTIKQQEVENSNLKVMINDAIKAKEEITETLNGYIVKCESLEKELFAMQEVNKHFEQKKLEEFFAIREEVALKKNFIANLEMYVEDFWSRIRDNLQLIKKHEERIAEMEEGQQQQNDVILVQKKNIKQKFERIDFLEQKLSKTEDELMISNNSYKMMRTKLTAREEEIGQLKEELVLLRAKMDKKRKKKKALDEENDDLKEKLRGWVEKFEGRVCKILQTRPRDFDNWEDQEIQCEIKQKESRKVSMDKTEMKPQKIQNKVHGSDRVEMAMQQKAKKRQDAKDLVFNASSRQEDIRSKLDMGSPLMNQFDIDEDHLPAYQKITKAKNRQNSMNPSMYMEKLKDSIKKPVFDDRNSDIRVQSPLHKPQHQKTFTQMSPLRRNTILPKGFRQQSTVEKLFAQQSQIQQQQQQEVLVPPGKKSTDSQLSFKIEKIEMVRQGSAADQNSVREDQLSNVIQEIEEAEENIDLKDEVDLVVPAQMKPQPRIDNFNLQKQKEPEKKNNQIKTLLKSAYVNRS